MHGAAGYRMAFCSTQMGAFYLQNQYPWVVHRVSSQTWEKASRLLFRHTTLTLDFQLSFYSALGLGKSRDRLTIDLLPWSLSPPSLPLS
jgi:hypothetical protein